MKILNYGAEYLRRFYEWEAPCSNGMGSSATESRVTSAYRPTVPSETSISASKAQLQLSPEGVQLTPELIQKIATYFMPKDWRRFSVANKDIYALLNSEESTREICPILYRGVEKLYANVRRGSCKTRNLLEFCKSLFLWLDKEPQPEPFIRLDKDPEARRLLTLPEYKEPNPESIQSLKDHIVFLREAGLLAKHSEDGKAVIVTIPKGWSIEKLETISQAAVAAGIASAAIEYRNPSRTILQSSPIEEEQRVAISNTVITGSRNKSIANQKALLKAKGLKEEFPDALTVLTIVVLSRILINGAESSYARLSQNIGTYTRTNKKTPGDWTLCVGSAPSCVYVSHNSFEDDAYIGVRGLRKFVALGT